MLTSTKPLAELHSAIVADAKFIHDSLGKAESAFSKLRSEATNYPVSEKYNYKSEKSELTYSFYLSAKENKKESCAMVLCASYLDETGALNGILVHFGRTLIIDVYNPQAIAQFREYGIKNNNLSDVETWDYMCMNIGQAAEGESIVELDKSQFYHISSSMEQISKVTYFGVFCGARSYRDKKMAEYSSFFSTDMLNKEQYNKNFNAYLYIHLLNYVRLNPAEEKSVMTQYRQLTNKANAEQWELEQFIEEGKKFIEKYPIGK